MRRLVNRKRSLDLFKSRSEIGIFIAAASANAIAGGLGVFWLRLVYREAAADNPLRSRPA